MELTWQNLLARDYKITGLVRSYSNINKRGLELLDIDDKIELVQCELTDLSQVISIVKDIHPDEIYNLAAQSSVSLSFKQPIGTISFNIISVLSLLETIRIVNPEIKFYQALSSEVFGITEKLPITETSSMNPISPYSISKASAYWITKNYREAYGIFSCNGFCFNHESFLRSDDFFIKKVIRDAIRIKEGKIKFLKVGNIDIKRDFGWAPKYVEAMYLMMQYKIPDDYIICSNISISLRSIIEFVFSYLEIPINCLQISKELYRPTEILDMYGDNSKAKNILGWNYDISFYEVLEILITEEIKYFKH